MVASELSWVGVMDEFDETDPADGDAAAAAEGIISIAADLAALLSHRTKIRSQ
jgi:hypothetical protein